MRCTISQEKAFKILEWILFIGFGIAAGFFASGVIEQFFSSKTSFTQHEEEVTKYPVISMLFGYQASEINQTDVVIMYRTKGMTYYHKLEIGENNFPNENYNKTEKAILESHEDINGRKTFSIIHKTPILDIKRPYVFMQIHTKLERKNDSFSDLIVFYLTSKENSPGFFDWTWKDGKPLQFLMPKNTYVTYNMQPQMTKYLEKMGNCQEESYYKCITSHLDAIEFNECCKKCIPNVFSNMGINYSTDFCQNDTDSQQCIFNHMMKQEFGSKCTKSCFNLEYFGDVVINVPYESQYENWDRYWLKLRLTNDDFLCKVFEEYLIYDSIGMIGEIGGTLGKICTFFFLICISWNSKILNIHFRNVHWILNEWPCFMDTFIPQKV